MLLKKKKRNLGSSSKAGISSVYQTWRRLPPEQMDVMKWLSHCLLSDFPSLTLCYPTTHSLLYYWKKTWSEPVNLKLFLFSKASLYSEIFVKPWSAMQAWWGLTPPKNNWENWRWCETCPGTWLPKTVGFTEHLFQFFLFISPLKKIKNYFGLTCRLVGALWLICLLKETITLQKGR